MKNNLLQFWIKMWVTGVILGFAFGYLWAEWDACTDSGGKYVRGAVWMECVRP